MGENILIVPCADGHILKMVYEGEVNSEVISIEQLIQNVEAASAENRFELKGE